MALNKEADFIGKTAAFLEKEEGGVLRLRSFLVEAKDTDVIRDEPICFGEKVTGWVTSGGFAHNSGVSVAMGYVPKEIAEEENGWSIEILGERCSATMLSEPLFAPKGQNMRK